MGLSLGLFGLGLTSSQVGRPGALGPPLTRFTYDIDFVAGTAKGGTQPYGNNTNDGRLLRDPTNVVASFIPNAAGLLVPCTAAGIRRSDRGQIAYPSATTRALWNRDLTNAVWVKSNGTDVTVTKTATGADGTANAASRVTWAVTNGTILQTITLASSTQVMSEDIKLVSGGPVERTLDGGATWNAISGLTSSYQQKSQVQAAVTNPVIGYRAPAGTVIDVDFVHCITAAAALSTPNGARVATTTATVLNSQSRPNADIGDAGPLGPLSLARFAVFWQGRSERASGGFLITSDGGFQWNIQANGSLQISFNAGIANSNVGGWRTGLGQVNKAVGFLAADGTVKTCLNGGAVGSGSGGTPATDLTHWDLSTNGAGTNSMFGWTERFAFWPNGAFTDAELIAMTT